MAAHAISGMFVVLLVSMVAITYATLGSGTTNTLSQQKLAVQNHLKNLNKPPVKSIQEAVLGHLFLVVFNYCKENDSACGVLPCDRNYFGVCNQSPDGDIIDCIHIAHQPAFDHPSLKNHTIKVRPSFHPEGDDKLYSLLKSETKTKPVTQLWHVNGRCPQGTIPIRRTREDDVLRASSIERFGKKTHRSVAQPRSAEPPDAMSQSGHQHAIVYVEGDEYYGAKGTINVWEPNTQQPNEFSLSQIWVLGGSFGQDLNSIEAGWQVSPDLYGDSRTRLFTYWTSDAYQATGCYNLLCSGFIQINSEIAMGASIYPVSSYRGSQYEISLLIWKDPKEGNWWLQFGNDHVLGYWPSSLFSYLTDSASLIEWGGEVVNSESDGQHTTTQMGSGHFPGEGFGNAGYFKNIQIVDGSNSLRAPEGISIFTDQSSCYDVQKGNSGNWGNYFFYGGPGRNPNCP